MDTVSFDNLEQIAQLLQLSYTGDTTAVKEATEMIDQLSQSSFLFSEALLKIIKVEKSDQPTEKLKASASLTLTRCLTEALKQNKLSPEQHTYLIRATIDAIFSSFVSLAMKINLQFVLILLYTLAADEIIDEGLLVVQEKLKGNEVNLYPPAFFLLQAIINIPMNYQAKIASWFEGLSDTLVEVGGRLAHEIIEELKSTEESQEKQLRIYLALKILVFWVKTIQEFLKFLNQSNHQKNLTRKYLKVIVENKNLAQVLTSCFEISYNTDKQIKECFISTSGVADFDSLINVLKANVLKCFNQFLDLEVLTELEARDVNLGRNSFFLSAHNICIPYVIKSLLLFFKTENLNIEEVHQNSDLCGILSECLLFANTMTVHPTLQPIFFQVHKSIIMDVCFPLIITNEKELHEFVNYPSQFVLYSSDCCGAKTSQTLKTIASKFLVDLCRDVDGVLSYAVMLVYCMIDYSMVSNSPETIQENYKDLAEHLNSIYISKLDATRRVEACFMIIGILHRLIMTRKDLLNMLEQILKTYKEFFFGEGSHAIIKTRLCMIFPYYSIVLFREEGKEDMFKLLLRFLIECTGADRQNFAALSEQANESLYSMFEKENLTKSLSPFTIDILTALGTHVPSTMALKLFDTIYEIVTSFPTAISEKPELLLGLLEVLINRGKEEYEKIRSGETKKVYLNKIWNIIRGIGEQKQYIDKYQAEIEKLLTPMFELLETNEDVDFDEDILNYATSATQISKKVSPSIWKLFQSFPKIFTRYEGMLGHLFPCLNYIIIYGSGIINQDPESIRILIEMGVAALSPKIKSADLANVSEGALFLQLILQYLRPIPNELLENILKAVYEKLNQTKIDFLRARFGGVFLCAFLQNFEVTQEILHHQGILSNVMDLFLKETAMIEEENYDRKVLVIGLSCILIQEKLYPEIENRFLEIFDIIISVLKFVRQLEQVEATIDKNDSADEGNEHTKKIKQELLMTFIDAKKNFITRLGEQEEEKVDLSDDEPELEDEDEEDEEEINESPFIPGKKEAICTLQTFETELNSKDEYSYFRDAVIRLKDTRYELIHKIVENLPPIKQTFLKEVLQSLRIQTTEGGAGQARKIVKARAKKIANIQKQ